MEKYKNLAFSYYNKAINLLEKHNIKEAINELKKAVKIYAQDTDILNLLGLCYYYKCEFEKAEMIWTKSCNLKKEDNSATEYIELMKSEKFKSFLEEFNHSIELIQKEDYSSAAKILFEINKEWDELLEPYLLLALISMKKGEYVEAQSLLKEAQELDQSNLKIKEYLIFVQEKLNDDQAGQISKNKLVDNSESAFSKKITGFKKAAVASLIILLLLGVFYNYQQNKFQSFAAEISDYKKELNAIQQKTESYEDELTEIKNEREILAAENLILENNSQKATENIKKLRTETEELNQEKEILAAEKENLNYDLGQIIFYAEQELFNKAVNLYRANEFSEAKIILENIYDSGNADYLQREALFFLANTELKLDNQLRGITRFEEYVKKYPGSNYHDEALYNLGIILNNRGEKREAKKHLKVLQKEYSQSIYNNQKIYNILE
ncbi:MAG: tetratricopeptide repeat protein [Bacillota bacterium]